MLPIVLTVALLTPSVLAQASAEDATLIKALSAWTAAWNSYDLNAIDELFVVGPEVSYYSSERSGRIEGIEALREHHRGFGFVPGGKRSEAKLWIDDVRTTVRADTAVVLATWFFQRSPSAAGAPQKGPMTVIFTRRAGAWRILHMHFANW